MIPLTPESPAQASSELLPDGGLVIRLHVPTYGGGLTLEMRAERDADGDWRVHIPAPDECTDEPVRLAGGHEFLNGIAYLGAPDVPVDSNYEPTGGIS